mmetsp:Transcript_31229/g.64724  ORF Transcript_31229/g.64724 Transcript_31229/m.64724 type:complete len:374 (+) Transcript_31229:1543-2664(+)
MRPLSIESVSNSVGALGTRSVLARFSKMRKRSSSALVTPLPTIKSTLTMLRNSTCSKTESQNTLLPARVMGIWNLRLDREMPPVGVCTSATTVSTKMLCSPPFPPPRSSSVKNPTPRGTLTEMSWSGRDVGLSHINAEGAHSWPNLAVYAFALAGTPSRPSFPHAWKCAARDLDWPLATRIEDSGVAPVVSWASNSPPITTVTCAYWYGGSEGSSKSSTSYKRIFTLEIMGSGPSSQLAGSQQSPVQHVSSEGFVQHSSLLPQHAPSQHSSGSALSPQHSFVGSQHPMGSVHWQLSSSGLRQQGFGKSPPRPSGGQHSPVQLSHPSALGSSQQSSWSSPQQSPVQHSGSLALSPQHGWSGSQQPVGSVHEHDS